MRVFISMKLQTAVFIHQELDRAGIHVADAAERLHQDAADTFAQFLVVTFTDGASSTSF